MASCEIDLVIDVGANAGQYARSLRDARCDGRIVSFEPGSAAFSALRASAADDPAWEARQVALGSTERHARLNLAVDDRASSLLTVMERHVTAAPESAFVAEELVAVRRLDSVWPELPSVSPYLKIDVQGGELEVLRGAGIVLSQCVLDEPSTGQMLQLDGIFAAQARFAERG